MSRKVTDLVNDHLLGDGVIVEGGGTVTVSATYRKAAALQMSDRAEDDGSGIWVSLERVAVWIECNVRTARRVMRSLENDAIAVDTGMLKTMPNGAVMPIYRIDLDVIRALPRADQLLQERKEAKVKKNKTEAAARAARRATVAAPGNDTMAAPDGGSRATMARNRATMAAEPVRTVPVLGSKEPKTESVGSMNGHAKGAFELTPNGADPKPAKRNGKAAVPMVEPEGVVEFYDKFRASPAFMAIPPENRARTHKQPTIAALTVLLAKYDRDVVALAIGKYYKAQKRVRGGADARGLDKMYATGDLEDLIRDEARAPSSVLSADEAKQKLQAAGLS